MAAKAKIKIGDKFGVLEVVEDLGLDKNLGHHWKLRCKCGNEICLMSREIWNKSSCGCLRRTKDLTGMKFNMLTVMGLDHREGTDKRHYKYYWKCICDCGKETIVEGYAIKHRQKSCGCIQKESVRNANKKYDGNGSYDRLYKIRTGMIQRCYNKNSVAYKHYGGRGITICKEWLESFEVFKSWALSHGYTEKLSIDRIDNEGNYEPSNCRWATMKEQSQNRRTCKNYKEKRKAVCEVQS